MGYDFDTRIWIEESIRKGGKEIYQFITKKRQVISNISLFQTNSS